MKRKVWDITVKDNLNRVVMGENDEFYTTDTEAFLVFNLQDEDFHPQSAMITLENRNDGSLKSEEVELTDGDIQWEMPERYIEHSGNWQAQLVYEQMKDGVPEKYTSGVMTFTVNSHIKDKKKPSLVEIENWEKFIAEGTELIETWEDMEDLRQANEADRVESEERRQDLENNLTEAEAIRDGNEQTRIDGETRREATFKDSLVTWDGRYESAEVERNEQYTTAESDRDEQYQGAESERDTAYSSAESQRDSQYSTSEAERDSQFQSKETERKDAEQQRENNEQLRESNRQIVEEWIANPEQFDGRDIEYDWRGSELGVRLEGEDEYVYVDLKGPAGEIENLETRHIQAVLGFVPKDYKAGDNIAITGDKISVTGQLGLTETEVKKVKVDKATDADTVGGHIVAKNVPTDAVFTDTKTTINGKTGVIAKEDIVALGIPSKDTIVDISGKVDKVVGKNLSTNDYSNVEKQKVADTAEGLGTHLADETNPHSTNKTHVGLSNVDNVKQMPISNGALENYREKLVTLSGTSTAINLSLGNVFTHTLTGNTTYSITNAVNSQAHSFTLIINMGSTARTLTFPASVKWQGGEIPDMSTANKTYVLTFMTVNGGTNWLGMFGGEFDVG